MLTKKREKERANSLLNNVNEKETKFERRQRLAKQFGGVTAEENRSRKCAAAAGCWLRAAAGVAFLRRRCVAIAPLSKSKLKKQKKVVPSQTLNSIRFYTCSVVMWPFRV